ncbi:MAG: ParB N-terminal domain-containing protein [Rhizobiales bacterium]|nr:ParB N-terminal domain-containing protein [Hyphomicrobiales bacterium]
MRRSPSISRAQARKLQRTDANRNACGAPSKSASDRAVAGEHPSLSDLCQVVEDGAIEHLAPGQLTPHPANARTHSKKQVRQIADSLRRFGFNAPIIINGGNMIIAGHGRVEAAKLLELQTVPCFRVTHLADAEERAYVLADNQIGLNSGWDRALLATQLSALTFELPELELPSDISITGFEPGEIDALLSDHEDEGRDPVDEVDLPRVGGPVVTRRQDLWLLGEHRLACGDCRDPLIWQLLMQQRTADMAITDPPYNVKVQGHVGGRGKVRHGEFAFASGEMSHNEYRSFLLSSLRPMADGCRDGALLYCFVDWRHVEMLCEVGRTLGIVLVNICVWNKSWPGQGSFYRSAHEFVAVFQKPGGPIKNNIELGRYGRSRTNVWTFAPPNKFKSADDPLSGHPTPKPIAMIAEAIKDASSRRSIVIDGFLGSGTTILAAEKVGRIGYGIEFEPAYCDLAITRWQNFTGKDAFLAQTGEAFNELMAAGRGSAPESAIPGASAVITAPRKRRGL